MACLAVICFSLMLMLSSVVSCWSKGIFIQPGARDGAMGSAMTAVADEATAVYYNPAGLAQQTGSEVEASLFSLSANATSNKSLANAAAPNVINGDFPLPNLSAIPGALPPMLANSEPTEYQSKQFSTNAEIPFIGAYKNVNGVTYALSVYGIGGGGGTWSDSVPALGGAAKITASLAGTYAFMVYNISAATKLTSKLMLGLGIDIVNMINETNAQKYFDTAAGNSIYGMAVNQSATGYGVQVNGGLLYKFNEQWKAGLVLRSGTDIKLNGQANGYDSVSGQTDYTDDYTYPLTGSVGVSYEPKNNLTLALSVDQTQYSEMHETINYNKQMPGVFDNSAGPLEGRDWKDSTQFHVGAEYRCADKLALRAGIENDPAPFSTDQLTLTEINQYNFIYYSIGAGYKIGQVNVDLCYAYCPSDSPSIGDRSYQYNLNVFRLGASYRF